MRFQSLSGSEFVYSDLADVGKDELKPAFYFSQPVHVVCGQAEIGPLVNQLQAHRLDLVLADEPASSSLKART